MEADNFMGANQYDRLSCPICGSKKSETIFTHARLANIKRTYASKKSVNKLMSNMDTNLCVNCGMLYRHPLMTYDELSQYYRQSYYETYNISLENQDKSVHSDLLRSWKKKYIRYFRFLAKNKVDFENKRVLDVGCGNGYFLAALGGMGASDCLGLEPSEQCREKIKNDEGFAFCVLGGCIRNVSPEKIGMFDFIGFIGVLEHLSDPITDLKLCRSLMKENACMYIYSHNESPNLFLTDINRRISLVHQLYFTPRSARILLEKVGLKIVALETRNTNMHILAKRCEPTNSKYTLNRVRYKLLKARYLICKKTPSGFFAFFLWFYRKCYAATDRVLYRKIRKEFEIQGQSN